MGVIWKYGDNINTDVIFAGKYTYVTMEPEEMAGHALEELRLRQLTRTGCYLP